MSDRNDGGTAFPMCRGGGSETHVGGGSTWMPVYERGMSLRDYFAAAALTGLMSDMGLRPSSEAEFAEACRRLYQFADAMIAQREKL